MAELLATLTGTLHAGSYFDTKKADPAFITVLKALDMANDPSLQMKNIKGLSDLDPFIKVQEGENGYKESFTHRTIRGIEDGDFMDSPTFKEHYEQWYMTKHGGIILKDIDITARMIDKANEMNKTSEISTQILERAKEAVDWYMNKYVPYSWYSTLLTVPTVTQASSYYAAPVGFLKNTPVSQTYLKPGVTRTTRNNYKAVADASVGVTVDDMESWVLEFTEFVGVDDSNIVFYGTRGSISKVRSSIAADVNIDSFNRTGKPSQVILGCQFVQNDIVPAGKLLMIDGNAKNVLTNLVSENSAYRGLAVHKQKDIFSDLSLTSLLGTIYKVMPEGKFVTGREKMMWIDLNNDAIDADLNMSDTGLAELTAYKELYESYWKGNI